MTTATPVDDKTIRRIQLLLNLGSRSEGNEAEAAAAMAKAQELLAAYNLDLATVQDKVVAGGTAEREAMEKRDYARSKRSAMYAWQRKLVKTIAEANYCVYWTADVKEELPIAKKNRKPWEDMDTPTVPRYVKRHKVLGRLVNTTAVMIMVDYLLDTIERLLPYPQKERLSAEANLWREGCADRLCERIEQKAAAMRDAQKAYATGGETAVTTTIQVADMAKKEEIANYDFRNGAGAWVRREARNAEIDAYYSDEAVAAREAEKQVRIAAERAKETPEQRARREKEEAKEAARQARESARFWEREWRRQDREAEREERRKGSAAYRAGKTKGDEIGLDAQVGKGSETKGLRGGV